MPSPKVSVIMAVHNGGKYVDLAIKSILNQTMNDFEFLIVEDGSTDNTQEILRSFDDPRIKVWENETNVGLAKSLNRGLALTQGLYIARQDADDLSNPDRLYRQVAYLDQHPNTGVLGTSTEWIDSEGNPTGKIWPGGADNAELQQLLIYTCPIIHGSAMYRRDCFKDVGGYDPEMRAGQDYDFWLRISETWDLACLSDVLYCYRWHENMASVSQKVSQARNVTESLSRALRRRLDYAKSLLRMDGEGVPVRMRMLTRSQLSQKYTWWSAGARMVNKRIALRFLLVALILDPVSEDVRRYLQGIVERKLKRARHIKG